MGKEYLEVDWELKEVRALSDNPISNIKDNVKETLENTDEILLENEIAKKWVEIINYFLNLEDKDLKSRLWINKKQWAVWFYWEWS